LGRIRVLPDTLINRIAAGEVVERPASVVKELIENGLDAGARSIRVELLAGGKRRIRVIDDGAGMDRDDALLALERHATSKLTRAEDLTAIVTLGFRGEALSSIAAVSRFRLETAVEDGTGTRIEVRAGRIESVGEAGLPRGTSIEVERLFFNVPARRKVMRTEATELAHIVRLVTRQALAFPAVRVQLDHGERNLLQLEPATDLFQRIAGLHGDAYAERLLPIELREKGLAVRGFAGRPQFSLPRRDAQHLFVNGRAVQDRVLSHAVVEAYGNAMPRGRHPLLYLFVELDPELVDVNVHPQKLEVRFRESSRVHDAVRDAVAASLSHEEFVPELGDLRPTPETRAATARAALGYLESQRHAETRRAVTYGATESVRRRPASVPPPPADLLDSVVEADGVGAARRAVPLGQFRQSYIVAQDREGLVLVDQHAAHERVLFERFLDEAEQNRVEVQKLLYPVVVELSADENLVLEQEADEFRRLGFRLEPFGERTVRVEGVPALGAELDPARLLAELLGQAAEARSAAAGAAPARRSCAAGW
jgi:DNA mismatch repair protein MutL